MKNPSFAPSLPSLRDHFAGQAIVSLIPLTGITMPSGSYASFSDKAVIAYQIADALLAARSPSSS